MSARPSGQSTLEYAILVIAVVLALLGLQFYLQRAAQGRMNESRWMLSGGSTPYYEDSQRAVVSGYRLNSNEYVQATTVVVNTTDLLGNPGYRRDTKFTVDAHFDECQTRNQGCP